MGGLTVTTFAIETYGRMGTEAETALQEAAAAAKRRNLSRGHPAGRPLQAWRATISATLAKGIVRAIRSAARETAAPGDTAETDAADEATANTPAAPPLSPETPLGDAPREA